LKIFTRGSVNSQLAPTISSSRTRQVKTPHITGDAENQHVENDGDHTGKNLSDKNPFFSHENCSIYKVSLWIQKGKITLRRKHKKLLKNQ
jgi:hypothetical protein